MTTAKKTTAKTPKAPKAPKEKADKAKAPDTTVITGGVVLTWEGESIWEEESILPAAGAAEAGSLPSETAADEYGLTMGMIAEIMVAADEKAAEVKAAASTAAAGKPKRGRIGAIWDAVNAGKLPPTLNVPASNYWSQRKADALLEMAMLGDAEGIKAMVIGGTNTYAVLVRAYQEACLAYAEAHPAEAGSSEQEAA